MDHFLENKLRLDKDFIENDVGDVEIRKHIERRPKHKDEVRVTFQSKQVRDVVQAKASNLANYGEEAGMRIHLPDHLQKDFKVLMNLAFDLKKRNPQLRRNVKFDEETMNLYMDMQIDPDSD